MQVCQKKHQRKQERLNQNRNRNKKRLLQNQRKYFQILVHAESDEGEEEVNENVQNITEEERKGINDKGAESEQGETVSKEIDPDKDNKKNNLENTSNDERIENEQTTEKEMDEIEEPPTKKQKTTGMTTVDASTKNENEAVKDVSTTVVPTPFDLTEEKNQDDVDTEVRYVV